MVRHFGCELEFSSDKIEVMKKLEKFLKSNLHRLTGETYKKWQVKDDYSTVGEVVSPVCTMKKLQEILDVCAFLRQNKTKITHDDGFHVHIQIRPKEIPNILGLWLRCEQDIERYFPKHRRNNQYCKRLRSRSKLPPIMSFGESLDKANDHHYVLSTSRDDIGTIEFRIAEGTFNEDFVRAWINFCFRFVEYASSEEFPDIFFSKPYQIKLPDLLKKIKLPKKDAQIILSRKKRY